MSILIKGMEMPQDKAVAVVIHPDGTAYSAKMFAGVCTEYLDDYTAVPVPKHGDLIERDKLREKEFIHAGDAYAVVMSRDIRNAPTIIPAEGG